MRIGIFLENWDKTAGGGFAYSKTIAELLTKVTSNHEFYFIIATSFKHVPDIYDGLKNFILYNPYDSPKYTRALSQNAFRKKKLSKLLKICDFFIDNLNFSFLSKTHEFINRRISKYSQLPPKDNMLLKKIVKEHYLHCLYYPNSFVCEDPDIPFYTTVWDLGHLSISAFPEVSNKGEFNNRQNFINTIAKRAHRIVSESASGKSDISFYYNVKPEKIVVVPQFPSNLVNLEISQIQVASSLRKFNILAESYFFYPAQFWPHKNHINLLKAISALRKEGVFIELILTGGDQGNLKFVLEFIESENLKDQIKYLGFVSDEEMKILYENAFALIFPSLLGPTNMPVSEALFCGCPVICSDFEGHREQTLGAALYVDPWEYLDIKDKIKMLYDDVDLREKLIKKGFEVTKKNSLENVFKSLLESFDEFEKIRQCWGY